MTYSLPLSSHREHKSQVDLPSRHLAQSTYSVIPLQTRGHLNAPQIVDTSNNGITLLQCIYDTGTRTGGTLISMLIYRASDITAGSQCRVVPSLLRSKSVRLPIRGFKLALDQIKVSKVFAATSVRSRRNTGRSRCGASVRYHSTPQED